jgi:hypothetical protein
MSYKNTTSSRASNTGGKPGGKPSRTEAAGTSNRTDVPGPNAFVPQAAQMGRATVSE